MNNGLLLRFESTPFVHSFRLSTGHLGATNLRANNGEPLYLAIPESSRQFTTSCIPLGEKCNHTHDWGQVCTLEVGSLIVMIAVTRVVRPSVS